MRILLDACLPKNLTGPRESFGRIRLIGQIGQGKAASRPAVVVGPAAEPRIAIPRIGPIGLIRPTRPRGSFGEPRPGHEDGPRGNGRRFGALERRPRRGAGLRCGEGGGLPRGAGRPRSAPHAVIPSPGWPCRGTTPSDRPAHRAGGRRRKRGGVSPVRGLRPGGRRRPPFGRSTPTAREGS